MDDEREGTKNPLSQDDGELDITREETDFTELANARAKEAMERLEGLQFASREARRKRKEAWEKEQKGTIHLSDTVDADPEAMKAAEQEYDQFGQPINNQASFDQFGQPMGGYRDGMVGENGVANMPQTMPGGQMGYGPMPNGQMNGAPINAQPNGMPGGQMSAIPGGQPNGTPQMVGQMGVVTNLDGTVPIASLDPTSRPMKQIPTLVVQKPKKIRKGWLIAISVSAFIAIAFAVLAVLIVANTKPDTVVKAIENITTNGMMDNVAVSGEIDFDFTNNIALDTLTVNLDGTVKSKSLENEMNVKVVADMTGGNKLGMEANEAYLKNNGVYLKLDKAGALMTEIRKGNVDTTKEDEKNTDTTSETSGESSETAAEKAKRETEEAWALVNKIISKADGKWMRINSNEADTSGLGNTKGGVCEAALINNLAANQSTIAAIYKTFPFITSTTKEIELEQVQDTVYKINIDLNNLTSFFNGIEDMKSLAAYEECRGLVQPAIVGSDVAKLFGNMRNVYMEVSEDYLITRVYFEYVADWGEMVADLYLSYPENIQIRTPEDSVDMSQVIKEVAKIK